MTTPRNGTRLQPGTIEFTFDGRRHTGQAGDSAASALHAAGVRVLNRSIKYRRPRGLYALGPEEPNALLTVGPEPAWIPNVPAPQLKLSDGLVLRSQNRWPSLRFDLASLTIGLGAPLWGAGFYYKTFMWPSWRRYEGLIRRLAGLGMAPGASDLPRVAVRHLGCDVLVAGAGPAGLTAALTAARGGCRVIVCEREPAAGGELEFEAATIGGVPALDWVSQTLAELNALGATVLTDTAVVSTAEGVAIAHGQPAGMPGADTLYRIHAKVFVNAMGAVEHGIAFVDNDLPGILLCGAADRLLARYGVVAGQRLVLFGNNERLYATARRMKRAGCDIVAVVDTRPLYAGADRMALEAEGVTCLAGHTVVRARGGQTLRAVDVRPVGADERPRRLDCDALLVSGGWSPALHAALRLGGTARYRPELAAFVATEQPAWRLSCGAASGSLSLALSMADGYAVARGALVTLGRRSSDLPTPGAIADADPAPALVPYWRSPAPVRHEKRQFVDLQNDVTVADLRQSLQEGFRDIEHVKRYTTLGVGTEQGRTGGILGAAILSELRGDALADVGVSRSRGPYQPVPMMALSGLRTGMGLRPDRRTPLHALHIDMGAELELMGGWMRPRFYRASGADAFTAGVAEAARVRREGGICDASTLGKIDVSGPDSAPFIDSLYLSPPSRIAPGRARYGALLREDGIVLDDGLVLRLGPDEFVATTSSSHLAHVLAHMEFWRDSAWPGRRIALTDVTEAWAVIVVAGPRSRDVLATVLGGAWARRLRDLTHMQLLQGQWKGAALRVVRASFTGELAYELHCQPHLAPTLWTSLAEGGLAPFGLEALDILRVEKGYLTSSELNGQTAPEDVGMGRMLASGNACVGRSLLSRAAYSDPDRPILVGLRADDGKSAFVGGAQITTEDAPAHSLGYVTSSVYSPERGEWVGLGLVARRMAGADTRLMARDPLRGGDTRIRVTPTTHVDEPGERIRS